MCNWALAVKCDRRDMKPVLQDYNSIRHRTFLQCHATRVYRPCTTKHRYMKHNRSVLYLYGKTHTEWTPRTNTRTQPLCPCYRLSGSKTLDPLPFARQGMFAFQQSHALLHMMTTNASSIFPLLTIFNAFQIVLSLYFSSNFPVPPLPYWKN